MMAKRGNSIGLKWFQDKIEEAQKFKIKVIDVNWVDQDGYTPLFLACWRCKREFEKDDESTIIRERRLKIVEILIQLGANVNYKTDKVEMSPLHWAAYNGDKDVVHLLLSRGAKLTMNKKDNSPVDLAGFSKSVEVIKTFCDWLKASYPE